MPITLFDNGTHKCIAFPDLVSCDSDEKAGEGSACESVQANQFLIVNNEHAALIDPGGNLTYTRLFMGISDYVFPKNLDYVIASHQDPDIVASLNKWLVGTGCKVVVPKLWKRFVPHFCSPGATKGRLIGIPDEGMDIEIGGAAFKAIPAHFLHSEGNFHFYDPVSRILFTGDVGASLVSDDLCGKPVKDFDAHLKTMEPFHRRYMASNKVCRYWVNMVRKLDVDMIVPQHGSLFQGSAMVGRFLDWFENLQCGTDLLTQGNYRVPGLAA
ncbi:MAG: MBL fold metallo-hydrolase [Gammaproteobacteria bacterium]|nr:MBL fold metallo-hydrolase [Gammaproteobacteria bacterium]